MRTVLVLGLVGGLVFALLAIRLRQRQFRPPYAFRDRQLSTDVINMSRIRVAGVGGLGLLAMAAAVAFGVPRIGRTLAVGLLLGAVFAVALIVWRRAEGPMPSSGQRPGAKTVLSIGQPDPVDEGKDASGQRTRGLQAVVVRTSEAL